MELKHRFIILLSFTYFLLYTSGLQIKVTSAKDTEGKIRSKLLIPKTFTSNKTESGSDCDCGLAFSCSLSLNGKRRCTCISGYKVKKDSYGDEYCILEECDCGNVNVKSCHFSLSGKRECTCYEGFEPAKDSLDDEHCAPKWIPTWLIAVYVVAGIMSFIQLGLIIFFSIMIFKKLSRKSVTMGAQFQNNVVV